MAIITFKSNGLKETGQTLSLVAVASKMAIERNYKVLIVSTDFNDKTLERCFGKEEKAINIGGQTIKSVIGMESGAEGLIRAMVNNKGRAEIINNYCKIVLKGRLDVLPSANVSDYKEYENIVENYLEIIQLANKYYDMVFVDLSKDMPSQQSEEIIQSSDIVVVNLAQTLNDIDNFSKIRNQVEFYKRKNIMLLIGRYDAYSKYNIKNITRYLKEKKQVNIIPYNTLFFESCAEGDVIEFFLKLRKSNETERNSVFMKETTNVSNEILNKLQELKMRI